MVLNYLIFYSSLWFFSFSAEKINFPSLRAHASLEVSLKHLWLSLSSWQTCLCYWIAFSIFLWIFIISHIIAEILPSLSFYLFVKRIHWESQWKVLNSSMFSTEIQTEGERTWAFHWKQPHTWDADTYGTQFHLVNKNVFGSYCEPGIVLGAEKQR